MKKTSLLLITLGLLIALYPLLERGYTWYWQRQLLAEFYHYEAIDHEAKIIELEEIHLQKMLEEATIEEATIEEATIEEATIEEATIEEDAIEEGDNKELQQHTAKPLAYIKIDKISLHLPILDGVSEKNLKKGAAKLKGTTPIGEIGNTAIAAHRSHTRGRLFNRLDELEVKDEIIIETDTTTYFYQVYKKHVVEPQDTTVLNRNEEDAIITLITCHPLYTGTNRLIIHAKLIQYQDKL